MKWPGSTTRPPPVGAGRRLRGGRAQAQQVDGERPGGRRAAGGSPGVIVTAPSQPLARSGRPASRSATVPSGRSATRRPPTSAVMLPQAARSAPAARHGDRGEPGCLDGADAHGAHGALTAREPRPGTRRCRTVMRKARARTGRGRVTVPSAPTRRAPVRPPGHESAHDRRAAHRALRGAQPQASTASERPRRATRRSTGEAADGRRPEADPGGVGAARRRRSRRACAAGPAEARPTTSNVAAAAQAGEAVERGCRARRRRAGPRRRRA